MTKKEETSIEEGLVTDALSNGMFRVQLNDNTLILGYISGKIRCNFIRVLPGDRVKIQISSYDLTKGRIIYRFRKNQSNNKELNNKKSKKKELNKNKSKKKELNKKESDDKELNKKESDDKELNKKESDDKELNKKESND
ncbi:hypothetical protein Droror1_Dr00028171 [Drosera rotundifolia]|jgi:translation initiation factor IF-1|uniref:Translation initiation factor IF-1, chloroplastic n=1 Tax=Drosera rotundifolia TaxID=173423 RepID=A0A140E9X5_DRORT|nr:infA [Drosera rotundifolia]AMK97338.1 InfA [Drosera rotundifolia]